MKLVKLLSIVLLFGISACKNKVNIAGPNPDNSPSPVPPVSQISEDLVVHGQAIIVFNNEVQSLYTKLLKQFFMPVAYAATSSATITYVNTAATTFTINTSSFVAGSISGDYLNLGSIVMSGLDDNKLKDCGPSNNQKCNNAYIRVYTTGSVAGFVHDDDGYGLPVLSGHNNPSPTTEVGLGSANGIVLQQMAIPGNKNRIRLSDFSTPTYNFRSDFSNGGAGNYSMTVVVEYSLSL